MKNTLKSDSILSIIKSRRSIRKFKDTPIKKEDLKELIEAGIHAPTGANTQCYRFVITTYQNDINYMSRNRTRFFRTCKAIIYCFADWKVCWNNYPDKSKLFPNLPYWDCGAAIQNILLLAEHKGIGTCWISMSPQMKCTDWVNKTYNVPNTYEVMGAIAIGYPNETVDYEVDKHQRRPIKRKPIENYILEWRE